MPVFVYVCASKIMWVMWDPQGKRKMVMASLSISEIQRGSQRALDQEQTTVITSADISALFILNIYVFIKFYNYNQKRYLSRIAGGMSIWKSNT